MSDGTDALSTLEARWRKEARSIDGANYTATNMARIKRECADELAAVLAALTPPPPAVELCGARDPDGLGATCEKSAGHKGGHRGVNSIGHGTIWSPIATTPPSAGGTEAQGQLIRDLAGTLAAVTKERDHERHEKETVSDAMQAYGRWSKVERARLKADLATARQELETVRGAQNQALSDNGESVDGMPCVCGHRRGRHAWGLSCNAECGCMSFVMAFPDGHSRENAEA